MKRIITNLGLLFGSLILVFIFIEIGFELLNPQKSAFPNMYESDAQRGFRLQNGKTFRHKDRAIDAYYHLNKTGNRDFVEENEIDLSKESILLLGDSFVFGMGVDFKDTYAGLLSGGFGGYQIVNSGVPGWGPQQYWITLKEYMEAGLNIKLVVVGYFVFNDLLNAEKDYTSIEIVNGYIAQDSKKTLRNRLNSFIVRNSHLFTLIYRFKEYQKRRKKFDSLRPDSRTSIAFRAEPVRFMEYAEKAQEYIANMSDICKQRDIPFLVLALPSEHGFSNREMFREENIDFSFPTKTVCADLVEKGIDCIDFWPYIDKDCFIFLDRHYNEKGHKIIAEETSRYIDNTLRR